MRFMPGFFDVIFGSNEPKSEPKSEPKKVKKVKEVKDFIHPMKRENSRLKAELTSLKESMVKSGESENDSDA